MKSTSKTLICPMPEIVTVLDDEAYEQEVIRVLKTPSKIKAYMAKEKLTDDDANEEEKCQALEILSQFVWGSGQIRTANPSARQAIQEISESESCTALRQIKHKALWLAVTHGFEYQKIRIKSTWIKGQNRQPAIWLPDLLPPDLYLIWFKQTARRIFDEIVIEDAAPIKGWIGPRLRPGETVDLDLHQSSPDEDKSEGDDDDPDQWYLNAIQKNSFLNRLITSEEFQQEPYDKDKLKKQLETLISATRLSPQEERFINTYREILCQFRFANERKTRAKVKADMGISDGAFRAIQHRVRNKLKRQLDILRKNDPKFPKKF